MPKPRERILQTSMTLFHQQGYNSTGINQIIEEADVSKASFYQHFKSKDDLCIEFFNRRFDYWVSELESFTSDAKTTEEKFLRSFDFLIYMNQKEDFRGCSFLNIMSEIPVDKKEIHTLIRTHKSKLRASFDEDLKDDILAAHIYLLFESCILTSQLYRSNELIEKSKLIVKNLLKTSSSH
ncbi:TetR/AcrR family transcriptional regulator [Chryseobacterium indologenes]|uniref:TetR/AcrR family transcriptional regulator n=1 Tax=Chryseobacterium TaxID=59732 RepID=UPI0003E08145|nr:MULTISPECIES: TetR/AcrR family transcriptional regulator [Chryseobacterium]AYZ36279.1 TetR/AcrR family transcriptional regulator [Chryseobacterium indologenes]MBF6644927.1 TetR/AcrR family transcriptional regulator [Chryseobacterium indologenes]MBU3047499.1 TetR/AcrR family transcriptional regulator [Chryseobacterium indologenes]MEB4759202.1 TetR/AcrR family transcriptional regulator [Chryseobacterium indologenes]QPQ51013.1 TetR/AcrR family transcriptional regulator [Chryseobacterium indolo